METECIVRRIVQDLCEDAAEPSGFDVGAASGLRNKWAPDRCSFLRALSANPERGAPPVWIVIVDLEKAFDKVERSALFTAQGRQGIDKKDVALVQRLRAQQTGRLGARLDSDWKRSPAKGARRAQCFYFSSTPPSSLR